MREKKYRAWNIPTRQMIYWGSWHEIAATDPRNVIPKHNIFMDWTGLKDKNKKPIYEGDIIKWGVHIGEVYLQKATFVFSSKGFGLYPCSLESEVIGNIYEHPDLIKN